MSLSHLDYGSQHPWRVDYPPIIGWWRCAHCGERNNPDAWPTRCCLCGAPREDDGGKPLETL